MRLKKLLRTAANPNQPSNITTPKQREIFSQSGLFQITVFWDKVREFGLTF